jgi:acyl-CoA thioester hydrolase
MCETQLRVRYAETDQMGVAHHASYVVWFEAARVEAMRRLGCNYKEMEQDGCHLPVVQLSCRYRAPAHYDDLLTIRTRVKRLRESLVHFFYEVSRDGELLAEGETVHIAIDDEGKKRTFPEKYTANLRAALGQHSAVSPVPDRFLDQMTR